MKTDFTHNRDRILRMDGKSPAEMREAIAQWKTLAVDQWALLKGFRELDEVLTVEDIPRVNSAVMVIAQVRETLKELQEFFNRTDSAETLARAVEEVSAQGKDAAEWAEWILAFAPFGKLK